MGRGRKKVMFSKSMLMGMDDLNDSEFRLFCIICCFTNGGGVVDDPGFVARGLRKDESIVDALIAKGRILHVGDEFFIRDFWLSNNCRKEFAEMLTSTMAWQRGDIRFEADEFNSPLVSAESVRSKCGVTAESFNTYSASTQPNTTHGQHTPSINTNGECGVNAESVRSGSTDADAYSDDTFSDDGYTYAPAITASDHMFVNTQLARLKALGYDEDTTRQWLERTIATEGRDVARTKVDRLTASGGQVDLGTGEVMA